MIFRLLITLLLGFNLYCADLKTITQSYNKDGPFIAGENLTNLKPGIHFLENNNEQQAELVIAVHGWQTEGFECVYPLINLNKESNRESQSDVGGVNAAILVPVVGGFLGQRKPKSTVTKSSNVTIKFDIISVPEEDIVATRSFSGDVNTTKETRGFSYDTNAFGAASGMDAGTRTAMTDAIYQGVEYLAERIK